MTVIKSTNNTLEIENGFKLAIVNDKGEVMNMGESVRQDVFDAMTDEVIKQFCSRFKTFTADDFKKVA